MLRMVSAKVGEEEPRELQVGSLSHINIEEKRSKGGGHMAEN